MRLLEHFDAVMALDDGSDDARESCARLVASGCAPIVIDLSSSKGWRASLAPLVSRTHRPRSTGVLVLAPWHGEDREFWHPQDRMVERLETGDWEIAFLGHRDGLARVPGGRRPDFIGCDAIPRDLSAIALRWHTLESVLELMPDRAIDGALTPSDWLTAFAWLSQSMMRPSQVLFAWPPLLTPRERAAVAA